MELRFCITGRKAGLSFTSWLASTVDAVDRPSVLPNDAIYYNLATFLNLLSNKLDCFQKLHSESFLYDSGIGLKYVSY